MGCIVSGFFPLLQTSKLVLFGREIIFSKAALQAMTQLRTVNGATSMNADDGMVEMLENIGTPRDVAKILVALNDGGFQSSRELQKSCGLRQPEISMAMKKMLDDELVACEPLKSGGRGRPSHRYSLNGSLDEMIAPFIAEAQAKLTELEINLSRLSEVAKSLQNSV